MDSYCINKNEFKFFSYILLCVLVYIIYILSWRKSEQMTNVDLLKHVDSQELKKKVEYLQNKLYEVMLSEQACQSDLARTKQSVLVREKQAYLVRNSTEPVRPSTSTSDSYQMLGYVFSPNALERYPLFGRYKYPGRSDRWEYYIIDEGRNRLKIPFLTKNYSELYDGDSVNIPSIGGNFEVKLYEIEQFRYNPNHF